MFFANRFLPKETFSVRIQFWILETINNEHFFFLIVQWCFRNSQYHRHAIKCLCSVPLLLPRRNSVEEGGALTNPGHSIRDPIRFPPVRLKETIFWIKSLCVKDGRSRNYQNVQVSLKLSFTDHVSFLI